MAAFILTWNPDQSNMAPGEYDRKVDITESGRTIRDDDWSVGNRRSGISQGDRAFLLRQYRDRGVVASGWFTSEVFQDDHWDGSDRQANYAKVEWDHWLPVDERLAVEDLKRDVPQVVWDRLQASGVLLAQDAAGRVEARWEAHLQAVGPGTTWLADEIRPSERYIEGAATQVLVNRYERDRHARDVCLEHWGLDCTVCGFNFARAYGVLGAGFMHVHHLRELSSLGAGYAVDPVQDLRPVCPNCHAMLHRQRPALTTTQLQRRLRSRPADRRRG